MKILLLLLAWCFLFVISWPVAVLVLILAPAVWLLSLPIRLLCFVIEAALAFLRAILFLPARLLGHRG